jgi:lipopolysaccharide transport system ATP-binding protein
MGEDVVIRVERLWKRYGLGLRPRLRALWRSRRSPQDDGPWALREVCFELRRGEILGVIGRNGAGKSTLLKVLAGVTPPTRGRVEVRGRVFPMIELNAGVHPDLTGRENARFLGAMVGLTRGQVRTRMAAIEAFCELGEWFDRPVRAYSSGMLARLGFAVAVNVDAEVLLIDEVLAVGDVAFQSKSLDRIEELHRSGATIVYASHSVRQVERLCDQALLLEQGQAIAAGEVNAVANRYYAQANRRILEYRGVDGQAHRALPTRLGSSIIEVLDIRLLDGDGNETSTFHTGSAMTIEVEYQANVPVRNVMVLFRITTADSLLLSGFTSELDSPRLDLEGRGSLRCAVKDLPLLSGVYLLDLRFRKVWGTYVGGGSAMKAFNVIVPQSIRRSTDYGIVRLEVEWSAEGRCGA